MCTCVYVNFFMINLVFIFYTRGSDFNNPEKVNKFLKAEGTYFNLSFYYVIRH